MTTAVRAAQFGATRRRRTSRAPARSQFRVRSAVIRYTCLMTRALNEAIAKLATLPADEQDRVAAWLLDELRDDEQWTRQFEASRAALTKLAAEARAARAAGGTTELDPDKL